MTFISLISVLLIEHWRPGGDRNPAVSAFLSYADSLERYFNTGERRHGIAAWVAAILPLLGFVAWIYYLLDSFSIVLAWMWNIAVLYLTMGFRKFSQSFTDIKEALKIGDLPLARKGLRSSYGVLADELNSQEIARVAIEMGLIHSHRHVFAIIISFAILPGPLGPVLYRSTELLNERWGGRPDSFGDFAVRAFDIIDWLPTRMTAMSFAITGNFEDAVYCWRAQAASWMNHNQGIILASGAGALGICLGDSLQEPGGEYYRPELGVGEKADMDFLQSAVGLVWRTLVLWLALILLLEMASWAG